LPHKSEKTAGLESFCRVTLSFRDPLCKKFSPFSLLFKGAQEGFAVSYAHPTSQAICFSGFLPKLFC
jgi:hypothetical protein